MHPAALAKPTAVRARSLFAKLLLLGAFLLFARFSVLVIIYGDRCISGDFCFLSNPSPLAPLIGGVGGRATSSRFQALSVGSPAAWTSREWRNAVGFYTAVFQTLSHDGFLSPTSKALSLGGASGKEAFALREIGVSDATAVAKVKSPPLVIASDPLTLPFSNETFDFVFCGTFEASRSPAELAEELSRTLKPEGFLVVHVAPEGDIYSFHSFLRLFPSFEHAKSRDIDASVHEIVLRKRRGVAGDTFHNKCSTPEHKIRIVNSAEAIIEEEPPKPWITLKKNLKNVRYLTSMVDIRFKKKYVYIDVGSRSYGSSIVSWFKKQYPKQNRTFDIYAIEADKAFHGEYAAKKNVKLLPYAAWVRNETLFFEVNRKPGAGTGQGMGRIRPAASAAAAAAAASGDLIRGFDFAEWIKSIVSEKDFVVMKMDVEGTEFDLIPRLFETGAICLIDELLLECHYNRWQRCCPGKRSPKYQKTYGDCLKLFSSLRDSGVLVHQWW